MKNAPNPTIETIDRLNAALSEARGRAGIEGGCKHLRAADHKVVFASDGKRVWRCSRCKTTGKWTDGWIYHGRIECLTCQETEVNEVLCPACAKPLIGRARSLKE